MHVKDIRRDVYNIMTDRDSSLWSYPVKCIFWVLSLVYLMAILVRDALYIAGILRPKMLQAKVISVGNLTVGGTGKTPMVIWIAKYLKERGRRVAVLTRGYGRDEYAMLKGYLGDIPVIVGKDRLASGRDAINRYFADTLILDDGFQYRKLRKDLNILLVDSGNPFGNGHLIPRGILRDRITSAQMAHVIVLTKSDLTLKAKSSRRALELKLGKHTLRDKLFVASHTPLCVSDIKTGEELPLEFLKERRVAVLSAIADPGHFLKLLKTLGVIKVLEFTFMDHHDYAQWEIDKLNTLCKKNNVEYVITTEKDASKLLDGISMEGAVKFYALKIEMDLKEDERRFADRLSWLYHR